VEAAAASAAAELELVRKREAHTRHETERPGGVSKTSRFAPTEPVPARGARPTVPVPAQRGQAQARQPSCTLQAQASGIEQGQDVANRELTTSLLHAFA